MQTIKCVVVGDGAVGKVRAHVWPDARVRPVSLSPSGGEIDESTGEAESTGSTADF